MMSLYAALRSLLTPGVKKAPARKSFKPFLDSLEVRLTPTQTITDAPAFAVINTAGETTVIGVDGAGKVTVNGTSQTTLANAVTSIFINGTDSATTKFNYTVVVLAVNRTAFPQLAALTVNGGNGNNVYVGSSISPNAITGPNFRFVTQTITEGNGNDTMNGGTGDETYVLGNGNSIVTNSGGNDSVDVGTGNNNINLGNGDDTFTYNGTGNDTVNLGAGQNTANVNLHGKGAAISVNTSPGTTTISSTTTGLNLPLINVETVNLNTGSGDDSVTIGTLTDSSLLTSLHVDGGNGTNTLMGPNVQTVYNFTGVGTGSFRAQGFSATSTFTNFANFVGGNKPGNVFRLNDGGAVGTINGGSGGNNTISYLGATNDVYVNLTLGKATNTFGISGFSNIIGGNGDDTLIGNAGANRIQAGTGNDLINGGGGADTIRGGSGDDTIITGAGNAKIYGGTGNMFITSGAGSNLIVAGSGFDQITTTKGKSIIVLNPSGNGIIKSHKGDTVVKNFYLGVK
jgi:Ca2+-binding RTX toxin-like protein